MSASAKDFDLLVIGTGPASSTVARKIREQGKRVAIVEAREFGGTCALRGCNPKKVLVNAAALLTQIEGARGKLLADDTKASVDWSTLMRFKQEFTGAIPEKSERSFRNDGIETLHATASFVDADSVNVGDQVVSADRILVGCGARPTPLPITGADLVTLSDDFLELTELPKRVVFIGGGFVSMEFAHVTARIHGQTTVLERNDRVLSSFDPDLTNQLTAWSRQAGVDIRTQVEVERIAQHDDGSLSVFFTDRDGDNQQSIECDLVVHGAGRTPNLDGLNLEAAGVDFEKQGILVEPTMRSRSNQRVFAAGDCAAKDKPPLTPTANEEARVVVENLFADPPESEPDYGVIPRVAYTAPAIAAVGMSQAEAEASGKDVDVRHDDTSTWNSVRKSGVTCAGFKVLVDRETDQLLGAHLLGPGAEESINLFALAMKYQLKASQLKSTLFAFPTFASDVRQMV